MTQQNLGIVTSDDINSRIRWDFISGLQAARPDAAEIADATDFAPRPMAVMDVVAIINAHGGTADIEPWALQSNPFDSVPVAKLPLLVRSVGVNWDAPTLQFRVRSLTTANTNLDSVVTFPDWLTAPTHFTYDAPSRQLGVFFSTASGLNLSTQVLLPNFLTAGDVTDFDIHDGVVTPANIQGADRFIFSDESVANDPMRYVRADGLSDYVLGRIQDSDIPSTLTRDSEVETFALIAHPAAVVGYAKMAPVVRGLSSLTYDGATRQVRAITTLSSGITEASATGSFPEWITLASLYDWAEEANLDTLPVFKIPNITPSKVNNLGEFIDDRVATQLLQPGTFLTWGYDDAAGTLTPTVLTDLVSVRQIIRDVHQVSGGLTETYDSQASTLTVGLDLDTLVQAGPNMTKGYNTATGVVTLDAVGGGAVGITAAQARAIAIEAVQVGGGIIRSSGPDNVSPGPE